MSDEATPTVLYNQNITLLKDPVTVDTLARVTVL